MTSVLATRAARRRWIAFLVLLVISVMLMGLSSNPAVRELQNGASFAFRPIQGVLDDATRTVSSVVAAIAEIDRLRVDNAALRSENDRLAAENARLEEIRRENETLAALLQLRAGLDYATVASNVIARESSEFRRLVLIDKGTDDGIAVGDVAVAAGGALAGRVVEVGPASAKVVLLTDSSSTVTGQLTTNAATGQVVGQLGGVLIMRQIDAGETVAVGDEVVTAGIELGGGVRSPYPKGLLVGQVVDVKRDANDVVQTAFLEPAAGLDKLENLLVITDYQGGLPPIEQQPVECGENKVLPEGEQPCLSPSPPASPAPTTRPAPTGKP
jgi:rod shape-determining protein MreC